MKVDKKVTNNDDDSVGYIEATYDSGNVLQSIYFPSRNRLYISFRRGHTYSYTNVDMQLYEDFESADSQGKFFHKKLRDGNNHPFSHEYKLLPNEIEDAMKIINENKRKLEEDE